ncbi:MAG: hypothetical protein AAF615_04220 [Pseudomonadota bacterium]
MLRRLLLPIIAATLATPGLAEAQDGTAPAVKVELNKMEDGGEICRAYFIVRNGASDDLDALELDTFLFDNDGIILQRLALPFGSVGTARMRIVSFDFELACSGIGSLFVNEVIRCDAAGAPCSAPVETSSRAAQAFEF